MAGMAPIERLWTYLTNNFTEFQLKTLGTFALHESAFFFSHIPFLVFDAIPFFRRWKIQPDKHNTAPLQLNCFRRVFLTHLLLVLPLIVTTHPFFDLAGLTSDVASLPSLPLLLSQVAICFLIEDFIFYWGHRALHTPFLYKNIHVIHHEHAAPFGIAAEYAHPLEVIFLGTATFAGPLILGPHLLTLFVYLTLRCMQTVECHSGYDFPWSPNRWLPFYGGAYFHDHHHRIHSGNYSSTFTWVDALFGTDAAFQLWNRKQLLSKRMPPFKTPHSTQS